MSSADRFLALMEAADHVRALGERVDTLGVSDAASMVQGLVERIVAAADALQAGAYSELHQSAGEPI